MSRLVVCFQEWLNFSKRILYKMPLLHGVVSCQDMAFFTSIVVYLKSTSFVWHKQVTSKMQQSES